MEYKYHCYRSVTWPRRGSLGCVHAQPEVGVSRPFFWCFRICCVVIHVRVLTGIFKSTFDFLCHPTPNRTSLCINPGLWLAPYIEAALTFFSSFFHNTCLAINKTTFFTMSVVYDFFLMRLTAGRRRVGMCGGGGGGLFGCNYD